MLQPNDAYIQELIQVVNNSPFPRHLPMRLSAVSLDRSTVSLFVEECHMQPFGMVHGGVLATLIDTATFWAAFLRLPEGCGLVNIDLKLNYLTPVRSGRLEAQGFCMRSGRTLSYTTASVIDGDGGELLAHGSSTLMALPGKGIRLKSPKFKEDKGSL